MGQRATITVLEQLGIRRHLPGRRRAPSHATLTRFLAALDGDALDAVVGAYLAERDHTDVNATGSAPRPAIAVDGKALSSSAHRTQRHRHPGLLSAVTHAPTVTLAQRDVGAKSNETAAFRPLLEPLDLAGTVVTFDARHSVKDQVRWLVQEKKAHYIAVIKGNQPTASAQVKALPWEQVPVAHTARGSGMRSWERALSVLEALYERGQAAGHGWTLDTELLPLHQQHVNVLENQGLVGLACREDRAELSALEGRPVRWAARLTPYGHDTLAYGCSRPRAEPPLRGEEADRQVVELIPSQMAALRVFVSLTGQFRVPPADGLAEQVRTASCGHGIKRWRLHLTREQMWSVAYGLWLHRMTGSAAEANRFGREYGVVYRPARASGEGLRLPADCRRQPERPR